MRKFLILCLILLILGGGILFFWPFSRLEFLEVTVALPKIAELIEKEIFTPSPLRATEEKEIPQVILNQQGVIEWTNIQREKYGFSALEENSKLNTMAQTKIEDMFQNQYFSHYSSLGEGVGDLAEDFGYEFLVIGENLALGNFQNDESLVEAWMASPGHRENILSPTYQEIGVAVKKGIFEGKTVWLAVQHFGLPLSACLQPSELVRLQIEKNQQELEELQRLLLEVQAELRTIRPKWGSNYQQKLEEYNSLVERYNNLLTENKTLINQYNAQIQQFNQCVAEVR
jgi:uncharacterized protein YkwD